MADSKYTLYSSALSGIRMEGYKDYPHQLTVYVTGPDGVARRMWDTTTFQDQAWMEKVQGGTGLQILHWAETWFYISLAKPCQTQNFVKGYSLLLVSCIPIHKNAIKNYAMHMILSCNTLAKRLRLKQPEQTLAW